jgi:hypothetical protein
VDVEGLKRRANDRLRAKALAYDIGADTVPFLCECADPACGEVVRVTVAVYIRRGDAPLLHPGHEPRAGGPSPSPGRSSRSRVSG